MTDLNQYLESLLKNGACRTLGKPLFRYDDNTALRFPAAETDHAYQDSHAEAYKYLLDGLDKDTITRLGAHAGAMVNVSSDRAADALGKVLDPSIKDAVLEPFQKIVSVQRRLADHGVRPPAQRFKAFEQFNSDMEAIEAALNVLRDAVAKECAVTVESCVARSDAMKFLPEIDPGNPV